MVRNKPYRAFYIPVHEKCKKERRFTLTNHGWQIKRYYDQIWFVRHMPEAGEHSREGIEIPMPYILTKFFAKEEYQQAFVKGDFYLSSLSAFTKVYSERALIAAAMQGDKYAKMLLEKQKNRSQRDILEGTIASIPPELVPEIPDKMRKMIDTDVMIRALGYDYCNVMCFCKMEYRFRMLEKIIRIDWDEPNMKDFDEYAIIVKNPKEMIRRIDMAVKRQNYQYVCGM